MNEIMLQDPALIEAVQMAAQLQERSETEFVAEAVRRHLAHYRQQRIQAETEAWYALPAELRREYLGQYVAVYNGTIVASNVDRLSLYYQMRERYGRQPVLLIEGGDAPMPVYQVRSPRRA